MGLALFIASAGCGVSLDYQTRVKERRVRRAIRRGQWVELFDGRKLDPEAWQVLGRGEWRVERGAIVGRPDPVRPAESWLFTRRTFKDFWLRIEYRLMPRDLSGIFFRCPGPYRPDDPGEGGEVHHPAFAGYKVHIGSRPPDYPTGSLYGIERAATRQDRPGEWNEIQILAVGERIEVMVNGAKVVDARNRRSREGFIGFQLHAGPYRPNARVEFQKVQIRVPPVLPDPEEAPPEGTTPEEAHAEGTTPEEAHAEGAPPVRADRSAPPSGGSLAGSRLPVSVRSEGGTLEKARGGQARLARGAGGPYP